MSIKLIKQIASYANSILVVLIITPIFLESFGTQMLSDKKFANESRTFYLLSNIIGQIAYPIFSSLNGGCIIIPFFEGMALSRKIFEHASKEQNPLGITASCLLISCLISFIGGLLIYCTSTGSIISKIPRNIVDTMCLATALFVLNFTKTIFFDPTNLVGSSSFFIISFLITILALSILEITRNPRYLIVYLILLVLICNSLKLILEPETLIKYKIFIFRNIPKIDLKPIIDLKLEFNFKIFLAHIFNIINLGIYPLISLSTALPYYLKAIGLSADFNKELLTQGLTNGLCGLGLFPTNFNSSGSILFTLCGASSRLHSIIAGLAMISLFYFYDFIAPLIPSFVVALIFQFIGFSILIGLFKQLITSTWLDNLVLLFTFLGFYLSSFNMIFVICLGIGLNYFISYIYSSNPKKFIIKQLENETIIIIHGTFNFINIHLVRECIDNTTHEISLDLSNCDFVDYTANLELEEIVKEVKSKNRKMRIFGRPENLKNQIIKVIDQQ